MPLTGELSQRCYRLLIRFDDFESHQSLKSIFVKAADLKEYEHDLPEAATRRDRVNRVIAFLLDKYTAKGSVFVIFLNELFSQVPQQDERYAELQELVPLVNAALSARDHADVYRQLPVNLLSRHPPATATSEGAGLYIAPATYPAAGSPARRRLFLSYNRHDYEQVAGIYSKLKGAGFDPWMDRENIFGGEPFDLAIARAIRSADFFLFFLSPHSANKRGYLQRELKLALDQWREKRLSDIYLIPLRLQECQSPEELSQFQWIDLFEEGGFSHLLGAIREGLRRLEQ